MVMKLQGFFAVLVEKATPPITTAVILSVQKNVVSLDGFSTLLVNFSQSQFCFLL